jgi:phage tail tape-measure protein
MPAGPPGSLAGTVAGAEVGGAASVALGTLGSIGWEIGTAVFNEYGREIHDFIEYAGEVQATTDRM